MQFVVFLGLYDSMSIACVASEHHTFYVNWENLNTF